MKPNDPNIHLPYELSEADRVLVQLIDHITDSHARGLIAVQTTFEDGQGVNAFMRCNEDLNTALRAGDDGDEQETNRLYMIAAIHLAKAVSYALLDLRPRCVDSVAWEGVVKEQANRMLQALYPERRVIW